MVNITTKEMLQIFNHLIDYLKGFGLNQINFKTDENYFKEIFDFNKSKTLAGNSESLEYGIGLLSEDIEFLQELLTDSENNLPSSVSLGKFGAILRAIAQKKNNLDSGKYTITLNKLSELFKIHMEYLNTWYNDVISFSESHDTYVLVKDFNHPDTIYTLSKDTKLEYGSLSDDIKALKQLLEDKETKPTMEDFARIGIILTAVSDDIVS